MTTLDPPVQPGFAIYRCWPRTLEIDRARFMPPDDLVAGALDVG